jgi:pyridoxine 5-phosphate synthase
MKTTLGVNVDHVATIREARKIDEPDPVKAASVCEDAGCHCITAHLREDRRHMQDNDIRLLKQIVKTKFNLEMSCAEEIVKIALEIAPEQVTLVPEKRTEVTTEGGLDVVSDVKHIKDIILRFKEKNIITSLFIDPCEKQIDAVKETGAEFIEIHTGAYVNSKNEEEYSKELDKIKQATAHAVSLGIRVNAGHGLNYINVKPIALLEEIEELNIGHSIISQAVFVGLEKAVKQMLDLIS